MTDAVISWISGPVLRARTRGAFHMHEAISVGEKRLLGEIIQLGENEFVAQVYEDTTGLSPGDPVTGTGHPLSVPLGPGLLGNIFDGLLRPLRTPQIRQFIEPGDFQMRHGRFGFRALINEGDEVGPGTYLGEVHIAKHRQYILIPPGLSGHIEDLVEDGDYGEAEVLCLIRGSDGGVSEIRMAHSWPVRQPRPVQQRLAAAQPMLTGQRVLDTLFPVARGGRAAIPGGFGTGKTVLQETLAKWCDADIIVYVGCGERGNEMAEVLHEFPELQDPRTNRPLMERTVIIANTSNMPVAAREASIYTAVTVAEYYRDQGLHVALMADSTSRWAEALREVSGRLGEMPGESGYPAYLATRLAEFYERAAVVRTPAGTEGSVTIIGAISPPAADFSEPVTSHTKRYVRSFWALDRTRAQARFYPAIDPLQSYSTDAPIMASWWGTQGNVDWMAQRERVLTLLEEQVRLERMARIVGKDSLPAAKQLALTCADLVSEGYLRQSANSPIDRFCSGARQTAMLRVIMHFIAAAEEALARGVAPEMIASLPILRRLRRMGEEIGEASIDKIEQLRQQIDEALAAEAGHKADAR